MNVKKTISLYDLLTLIKERKKSKNYKMFI